MFIIICSDKVYGFYIIFEIFRKYLNMGCNWYKLFLKKLQLNQLIY